MEEPCPREGQRNFKPREGSEEAMRTFYLMILAFLAVLSLAGCPSSDDTNCASSAGCGDPSPDGGGGGGGDCSTADGDACPAPMAIRSDCSSGTCVCNDSHYTVACPDNDAYCWPTGTDCGPPRFACGTVAGRCESEDQAANCCGGVGYLCPADAPYYCTEDGTCRENSGDCASTCEYYGSSC